MKHILFLNTIFIAASLSLPDVPNIIAPDAFALAISHGNVKCVNVFKKQFMQLKPYQQMRAWQALDHAAIKKHILQLRKEEISSMNKNFLYQYFYCFQKFPSQKINDYLIDIENCVKNIDI